MALVTQYRLGGAFLALFFGIGVPGFLLGPFIFSGVSLALASTAACVASAIVGIVSTWLLVIFLFADEAAVVKVSEIGAGAGEIAFLFLPYILWQGTASVLRRVGGRLRDE